MSNALPLLFSFAFRLLFMVAVLQVVIYIALWIASWNGLLTASIDMNPIY